HGRFVSSASTGSRASGLIDRHSIDLFEARDPVHHFLEARHAEIRYALALRLIGDLHGVAAFHDDPADRLRDRHHLIDADPPLVAPSAMIAAFRVINRDPLLDLLFREALLEQRLGRHVDRLLAVLAQPPREPLRDDDADRARDGVRLHAHVDEARQRLRRVVRVQRGQHEVSGLRGLDRDLGRLEVADLADHDHVRVLAKERAERRREGQPDLRVDVNLVDPGEVDFRRILGGRDVAVPGVQDIEAGIERDRLTAARRAGHEDHAVRLHQVLEVELLLEILVSESIDAELRARRIEQTADDLLAEQRRAGVDAEVDRAVLGEPHLDAAVLRNAALGDIEPGHDLDACRNLARERDRRSRKFGQHAVLPQADPIELLVRLEMDVRRAALDRVEHHLVHEADARRIVDVGARDFAADLLGAADDVELLEIEVLVIELRHRRVDGLERALDAHLELVLLDDDRLDAQRRLELDLVDRLQVRGIADRDVEPLAALQDRQHAVLREELVVDEADDVEIDLDRVEVEQRHAELVRGRDRDLPRVAELVRDEIRDEARAVLLDRLERAK